jgi:hypothetical protein
MKKLLFFLLLISFGANAQRSISLKVSGVDTSLAFANYIRTANYGTIKTLQALGVDTSLISTKANVTASLIGYAPNALVIKYTDSATMLGNYTRTANYGITKTGQAFGVDTSLISTRARLTASLIGYAPAALYVPYTGATGAVNLGTNALTSGALTSTTGSFSSTLNATGEITTGSVSRAFLRQTAGGDAELGAKTGGVTSIWSEGASKLSFAVGGAATISNSLAVQSSTASTSTITGALTVAGGIGVNAQSYMSGLNVATIVASQLLVTYPINLQAYTVATLPALTGTAGYLCYVTDALTPTWGATVVGGGAVKTLVMTDGTAWKVH